MDIMFIQIKHFLPRVPKRAPVRILGLDPTSRGCAFAALEGESSLIDWGTTEMQVPIVHCILSRVEKIIDRCAPDLIAVEDGRSTRRGRRAKEIIEGIERIAKKRTLRVVRVTRRSVRETFSPATTKQQIAEALARRFPELAPRLPRPRKCFDAEDNRMNVFDALSFAVAAQST
jgi:Holliday junction resolvasome RuvABC endonuclease subunit